MAALEQQNPKSKYLDLGYASYLNALNQSGASAKAAAVAEKALANFPENQDLLVLLANNSLQNKQFDRALDYSKRLIAVIAKHPPKPGGVSDADWTRKENSALGIGHWIAGIVYAGKTNHNQTDTELRAALPLITGNNALMGPALFYLGVANYNLGKSTMKKAQVLEAVKYSQQASAITGPYAQQARHNALAMKGEADKMH
jgi:tetratricopeptide (TPR) repeat protein